MAFNPWNPGGAGAVATYAPSANVRARHLWRRDILRSRLLQPGYLQFRREPALAAPRPDRKPSRRRAAATRAQCRHVGADAHHHAATGACAAAGTGGDPSGTAARAGTRTHRRSDTGAGTAAARCDRCHARSSSTSSADTRTGPRRHGATACRPAPAAPPPTAVANAAPTPPETVAPRAAPTLASIPFTPQSAEINGLARTELDRVAQSAKGVRAIELRAYAGGSDPTEARKVALARALSVRSYLIDQGVQAPHRGRCLRLERRRRLAKRWMSLALEIERAHRRRATIDRMTNPLPYLVRMLLFLAAVAGLAFYLRDDLIRVFNNTPDLDAVILFVLLLGIFFIFRQVIILWPEVSWLRRFQHRDENAPPPPADRINLLAPMAAMLGERADQFRLSPTASRALLDGIATRLDERRELARYLIGLLIFLGLLGTFWGLLQTIGAVADAINGLQVSAGDAVTMFGKLKASIEGPLKGMSTAFGASLFGLSGSLVLGFLELQASQAQGRFHIELEEWLASATSLTSPALPVEVSPSAPAYVEALLERNAEGLDGLARILQRIEESRQVSIGSNATLVERLASLSETMRTQQNLMARFTELSIEMRAAMNRLGDRSGAEADREAMAAHHRNLEAQLNRLVEEEVRSRVALADELRGAFSKLSDRTADEADREALLAKQHEVEAQVAKLADENARSSSQITEEVRQAIAKLSENGASTERRQQFEARDGQRLAEEQRFRSHADLIAELRNMAARVTDRTAAEADRDALLAHQRSIESQVGKLGEDLQAAAQRLGERPADTGAHQALVDQQHGDRGPGSTRLTDRNSRRSHWQSPRRALGGRGRPRGAARPAARPRRPDRQARRGTARRDGPSVRATRAGVRAARTSQVHQRNVEAFLGRLSEENARARGQIAEELNSAMTRMPDRAMAEADRESLASHQRNIESHLARLIDENARNRTTLVDELREAIARLTERFAENDREAVATHQRNIEGHLVRLTEEATQNRTSLADELRGEIRLLARTLAISRKEG